MPSKTVKSIAKQFPSAVKQLGEKDEEYQIWKSAWHNPDQMFDEVDGFPVLRIGVPNTQTRKIFIRPEYVHAYEDAMVLYDDAVVSSNTGTPPFRRVFRTPDVSSTFDLAETTKHLHRPDPHSASSRLLAAMIISGHPGSGKSISLWYFLVRRLAVHGEVVLQTDPDFFDFFHSCGVTRITAGSSSHEACCIREILPFSTWCLVDSHMHEPPYPGQFFSRSGCFIIQVAPLSTAGIRWEQKNRIVSNRYIMRAMSLQELEYISRCSEITFDLNTVRDLYTKYGPSTLGIFNANTPTWEDGLQTILKHVARSPAFLVDLMERLALWGQNCESSTFKILLLSPGYERHERCAEVITEHVENELVKRARRHWGKHPEAFCKVLASGPPEAEDLARSFRKKRVPPD